MDENTINVEEKNYSFAELNNKIVQVCQVLVEFNKYFEELKKEVDEVKAMAEANAEKCNYLDEVLYNQVLNPAMIALEEEEKNLRFDEFKARHENFFDDIMDDIRAIEGDEIDPMRKAFDDIEELKINEEGEQGYLDDLKKSLVEQITRIKERIGAEKVEVEATDEGVKVEAKDEEGKTIEVVNVDSEGTFDNPDEVAEFEKELEAFKG